MEAVDGECDRPSKDCAEIRPLTQRRRAGRRLRVEVSEEGTCALFPDREKAGDQVVEHEGDVLLLIGEDASQPLDGATIDLAQTPEGARLVVTKPHLPADGDRRV
jgi:Fe-S cluster assembly iron-binding protein IscA